MLRSSVDRPFHVGLYSPAESANGISTYVRIMSEALRSLGHSVTVIRPEGEPSRLSVLRERFRKDGSHPYARAQVLDVVRSFDGDVIEMEESFGWAAHVTHVPVVMRMHGPHVLADENLNVAKVRAELAAFKSAAAVTSPTQTLLDQMSELTSWKRGRVIPNPVVVPNSSWDASGADLNQILFVGRNDRRKGADIVKEAFEIAKQSRPELTLVCVGPGFETKSGDELTRLRLESGLAVIGSRFEVFPYILTEAMALGMPVVSSRFGGAGEIVTDRVDGRLVPPQDPRAMAAAMLETIGNVLLGKAARETVARRFDPVYIAKQTVELYRQSFTTLLRSD